MREPVIFQQDMIDIDGDPDRFARGGEIIERRMKVPDYGYRLPEEIAFFTTETVYDRAGTSMFPLSRAVDMEDGIHI